MREVAVDFLAESFLEDAPRRLASCLTSGGCPRWRNLGHVPDSSLLEHEQMLRGDVSSFSPFVRDLPKFRRSCSGT